MQPTHPPARRAVFLDRDGTLNEDPGYVHRVEDLRLRQGVPEGLAILGRLGLPLIVVTNQGGIGRGKFTEAQMHAFNRALAAQALRHGARLDQFYWCPHHPRATDPRLAVACACRKPEPGLLVRAARDHGLDLSQSFLLGDHGRDAQAAERAGATGILITNGPATATTGARHVASDFLVAARMVERLVAPASPAPRPQPG